MTLSFEQFKKLREKGLTPQQIASFESGYNPQQSTIGKVGEFFTKGKALKPAGILFETLGKTAGKTIMSGIEGISELAAGKTIEEQGKERKGFDIAGRGEQPAPTKTDIAFTALELYPGGGFISSALRKVPGGSLVASKISEAIKVLPENMRERAVKLYTEALAPTTKKTKGQAEKIVPELIERGETGTLKSIKEKAESQILKTGEQIDEVVDTIKNNKVVVKPILEAINNFKKKFIIDDVVIEPNAIKVADEIESVVLNLGDEVEAGSLIKLRRLWDKMIEKKGAGFGLDDITTFSNDIKKEATASIRGILANESPELAQLNKEFSFWSNVDNVIGETLKRTAGQSGKLRQRIGQGIGAIAGASQGVLGAFFGSAVGSKITQALESSLWKTKSAVFKNNFADALVNGNLDILSILLKELGVSIKNITNLEK